MNRLELLSRWSSLINLDGGCWRWVGYVAKDKGYGYIRVGPRPGKLLAAHRLGYILLVGEIPEGLELDHLCRNRWCVKPSHLEPVTHKVNVLRGVGFPATNSAKTHCKFGHLFDTENTYITPEGSRNCRKCRAMAERKRQRRLKGVASV